MKKKLLIALLSISAWYCYPLGVEFNFEEEPVERWFEALDKADVTFEQMEKHLKSLSDENRSQLSTYFETKENAQKVVEQVRSRYEAHPVSATRFLVSLIDTGVDMKLGQSDNSLGITRLMLLSQTLSDTDMSTVFDALQSKMNDPAALKRLVNIQDETGATVLMTAIRLGKQALVTELMLVGSDLFLSDNRGKNGLMYALDMQSIPEYTGEETFKARTQIAQELIRQVSVQAAQDKAAVAAKLNRFDSAGWNAFSYLANGGSKTYGNDFANLVMRLKAAGANITVSSGFSGYRVPLTSVTSVDDARVVVANGANPNAGSILDLPESQQGGLREYILAERAKTRAFTQSGQKGFIESVNQELRGAKSLLQQFKDFLSRLFTGSDDEGMRHDLIIDLRGLTASARNLNESTQAWLKGLTGSLGMIRLYVEQYYGKSPELVAAFKALDAEVNRLPLPSSGK